MPIMFFFLFLLTIENLKHTLPHCSGIFVTLGRKKRKNQDYETTVPCTTSSLSSSSICSCLCDVNNLKLEVQVKQVTPPTSYLHIFFAVSGKGKEREGNPVVCIEKSKRLCVSALASSLHHVLVQVEAKNYQYIGRYASHKRVCARVEHTLISGTYAGTRFAHLKSVITTYQ